jgi:hypothetical protein
MTGALPTAKGNTPKLVELNRDQMSRLQGGDAASAYRTQSAVQFFRPIREEATTEQFFTIELV